ncbi:MULTISPECIES: hypothetical protein [Nostoc]|nr:MULTISPECIES: hypothetical protein [Nostoc]
MTSGRSETIAYGGRLRHRKVFRFATLAYENAENKRSQKHLFERT